MKSLTRGKSISKPEVTHISMHGIWVLFRNTEYFAAFDENPWFRDATVAQIQNVILQGRNHFHWPDLDVDLDIDRIVHPDRYPFISSQKPVE